MTVALATRGLVTMGGASTIVDTSVGAGMPLPPREKHEFELLCKVGVIERVEESLVAKAIVIEQVEETLIAKATVIEQVEEILKATVIVSEPVEFSLIAKCDVTEQASDVSFEFEEAGFAIKRASEVEFVSLEESKNGLSQADSVEIVESNDV